MREFISRDSIGRYSFEREVRQSLTDKDSKKIDKHYKYEKPIEYWLIIIGLAIGYGSFWRFPYLIYSCGGGVFFIPFFIFLFFVGIPLFSLEAIIGQLFKKGPVEFFSMINKKYTGIGWASVIVSWIISIYYAIILCWSYYFFFCSFLSPLPYSPNNDSENTIERIINTKYFKDDVLKISDGIHEMGSINIKLMICLAITYISIFLCIYKGVETSSKVAYITAPAPIVLLVIMLFKGLNIEGYQEGLKYLFIPDLTKLLDGSVWIKASNQVLYMISLGIGCNILFATSRKENENVFTSSFWVPIITVSCGTLCSIINFCFIGHLSYITNIPINNLPLKGTDLAFITYPAILNSIPYSNFWALLFFIMLITLGIDSQFGYNEICSEYLYEFFLYKYTDRKRTTLIVCCIGFLFGIPMLMNGGLYLFDLIDQSASMISLFVILFLEVYVMVNFVGCDLIKQLNDTKTKKPIPEWIYYCLEKFCSPSLAILLVIAIFNCLFYGNSYSILWPKLLEWIIILSPLSVIIYFYFKYSDEKDITKLEILENIQ